MSKTTFMINGSNMIRGVGMLLDGTTLWFVFFFIIYNYITVHGTEDTPIAKMHIFYNKLITRKFIFLYY